MPVVHVKDFGEINFPETMTQAEIESALAEQFPTTTVLRPSLSAVEPESPTTSYFDHLKPKPSGVEFGAVPLEPMSGFEVQKSIAANGGLQNPPEFELAPVELPNTTEETEPRTFADKLGEAFAGPGTESVVVAGGDLTEGLTEGLGNTAAALVEPKSLAIGAGFIAGATIAPVTTAVVAGMMGAKGLGESLGAMSVAAEQGDVRGVAREVVPAAANALMVAAPLTGQSLKKTGEALREVAKPIPEVKFRVEDRLAVDDAAVASNPQATPHYESNPSPERVGGIGIVPSPATVAIGETIANLGASIKSLPESTRALWRSFSMESLPRITKSSQEAGEAGVRAASARQVGRGYGELFADKVLDGTGVDPFQFGIALTEDNLRSVKASYADRAIEAQGKGLLDDAADLDNAAQNVRSFIGSKGSPFKSEAEYQAFLESEPVKVALDRHKRMWEEQKDPLFRQANDLDPMIELASRGLQTGARINLKGIREGDMTGPSTVGQPAKTGIKQLATLKRRDPFSQRATGMADSYEGNYREIMAHGFEREMPIAAQHEFVRKMIDSGDAIVSESSVAPGLEIKGEPTTSRLLNLRPWSGRFLHVRNSLVDEYSAALGLIESSKLTGYTKAADFFTKQSIMGLAEGTTHMANLMTEVFNGLGPSANPLLNAMVKSLGRVDLVYTVPKVFMRALKDNREAMLDLAKIGAAKKGYQGLLGKSVLDPTDRGVRLVSADLYKSMAEAGWVQGSETGLREFVNQVGQYNKQLQPKLIRKLRETGVQPFATAIHTFNVMGLRRMLMGSGAKPTSKAADLALRADIFGGWIGFVTLAAGLNYMLSGDPKGPTGTKLGEVGWVDDEGNLKSLGLAKLAGYERGLRITGILPAVEARNKGLTGNDALSATGQALGNAAVNYVTGPLNRAAFISATGKTPSVPAFQEAPVMPPSSEFAPLRSQFVANIATALKEANPLINSAITAEQDRREGKETGEIVSKVIEKQAYRFSPHPVSPIASSEKFPEIIKGAQLNNFTDYVAREARKRPLYERREYVNRQLEKVDPQDRARALDKIRMKRTFKP